jgi:hypothetical protein
MMVVFPGYPVQDLGRFDRRYHALYCVFIQAPGTDTGCQAPWVDRHAAHFVAGNEPPWLCWRAIGLH